MIETTYGGNGDVPVGWREVNEKEFVEQSLVRIYAPKTMNYRQFTVNGEFFGVQLWMMHDGTGHCFYLDYWPKKVRFFLFGCAHDYEEISRPANNRSGLHTSRCKKCDYVQTVDTSD